jgi:hypothetical protein
MTSQWITCGRDGMRLLLNAIRYTLCRMNWIRSHRYTVALLATAIFVIVGGFLATNEKHAGTTKGTAERSVSVNYPYYVPPTGENGMGTVAEQNLPAGETRVSESASSTVLFFGPAAQSEAPAAVTPPQTPAAPSVTPQPPTRIEAPSLNNTYALFFQRLSNILSPKVTRTPEQQALFDYGNTAGSIIKRFESAHRGGTPQILKAFFDDHTSASIAASGTKIPDSYAQLNANTSPAPSLLTREQLAANVQGVSDDYAKLSAEIRAIPNIPPYAESANGKLAVGYDAVAKGLSALTHATTDKELLAAIDAYNATADTFIKTYVSIVDLFSAYGVTFAANDPGAIFSFNTGSL